MAIKAAIAITTAIKVSEQPIRQMPVLETSANGLTNPVTNRNRNWLVPIQRALILFVLGVPRLPLFGCSEYGKYMANTYVAHYIANLNLFLH